MNIYNIFRKGLPFALPLSALIATTNHPFPTSKTSPYFYNFNVVADDNTDDDEFISNNFKHLIYPSKADDSETRKFLNFLEMLPRHKNVLIIGSNPCLRDITFLTQKNVTCCDYSIHKLECMRNNMNYGRYIEEELIQINNNKIPIKDQYDLILCIDGHLNMMPFDEWNDFLRQIFDALKFTGFFILKIMNKSNDEYLATFTNPERIVEDWSYSKYRDDIGYLFINLLMYLYHKNGENGSNFGVNWSDVIDLVSQRCDEHNWEWSEQQKNEFFDRFNYLKDRENVYYCKNEEDTKALLTEQLFYLQQTCYGKDDADKYKYTPIYVLGKQSSRTGGQAKVWGHAGDYETINYYETRE